MTVRDMTATALLEDFPEATLLMRPDGALLLANPAACRLLEFSGSPEGRNITEFLPEQERSRLNPLVWMQRWAEVPDAPEIEHVHLLCRTAQGSEIPVRVRVGRAHDGTQTVYVVMLHDISQQQHRQHEARLAHRLAARVLAVSADAIVIVDQQLNITYVNESTERLFEYPGGALIGKPLNVLLPEEFRDGHETHVQSFARESSPSRLMGERKQVQGLTRSGAQIPLDASITKVTLDQNVVFSAHLRDLRPRQAADAELARALARFRAVFDHALQAMAILSVDGQVQEMNRAARALMPADEDPIGQQFASLPFWSADPEATSSQLHEAIELCLSGDVYRMPAEITFPDGSTRQLDFSLSPVTDGKHVFSMIAEARELPELPASA